MALTCMLNRLGMSSDNSGCCCCCSWVGTRFCSESGCMGRVEAQPAASILLGSRSAWEMCLCESTGAAVHAMSAPLLHAFQHLPRSSIRCSWCKQLLDCAVRCCAVSILLEGLTGLMGYTWPGLHHTVVQDEPTTCKCCCPARFNLSDVASLPSARSVCKQWCQLPWQSNIVLSLPGCAELGCWCAEGVPALLMLLCGSYDRWC